eukprot:CAMPEP_0181214594 /NCGR_PEP_ID=MMETSP1096-20121128/25544_1 /TAXON_ID=156174 ORGANISM="Chrysochromulina ericina, Strain CCMP281" /NCGR_SAMPLE_ID=MMETSP1096 /ASSEMBLY_ACC=CAM_ASM_000453 /LENGTH=150 /DNA_ID=CAMNT_0023306355 /DNA_START=98 /DNA_END=550 /DNA_ORIENTATION=-
MNLQGGAKVKATIEDWSELLHSLLNVSIHDLPALLLVLSLHRNRVEPTREQQLNPPLRVVRSVFRHEKVVPRAVHDIKEMGELMDTQAVEVGVHKGIGAYIGEPRSLLSLFDRSQVEQQLLTHEARHRAWLIEEGDLGGVPTEDEIADVP